MSEYRLSKSNNNKLQKSDGKKEVAKVREQKTDVVPVVKNYLVNVTTGLAKTTGHALTVVGNKLSKVDWGKLILKILTWLVATTPEEELKTYSNSQAVNYSYGNSNYSKPKRQQKVSSSKPKPESIETHKEKQIEGTKNKVIENKKNSKQIQKKKVKKIAKPQQQTMMIEQKDKKAE